MDGRRATDGCLIEVLRHPHGRHAVHRCVLDRRTGNSGTGGDRGVSGQRAGNQNLPGRKSDVQECQWLMKLHTYGLLLNSFRPPEEIRSVRTVWRLRDRLVKDAGRAIQQIQKALTVRRSLKSRQRDPSNGAIPSCVGRTKRASTWSLSYVACLG